jgi:resuscitation-promoting factor RpfB
MSRRLRRSERQTIAAAALAGLLLAALGHGALPSGSAGTAAAAAPVHVAGNVALGQQLAAADGWGSGAQWNCLYDLWQRESGWSNTADNAQSGAYGIAQALGHGPSNQYPAGPANPPVSNPGAQIRWGLGYIRGRYGSPCAAWAHETANSWY